MVYTYYTYAPLLPDPSVCPEALEGLDEERKAKALRYLHAQDRKLGLGAGLLLKFALGRHGITNAGILTEENGKPYTQGLFFNLSHSYDYVVCSVSTKPVGCDVERISEGHLRIAERYFCKSETDYIFSFSEEKQAEEFFRLWTVKEAYMKLTGEGMRLSLHSFSVDIGKEITVTREGRKTDCSVREYGLCGYKLSVCAEENEFAPELIEIKADELLLK